LTVAVIVLLSPAALLAQSIGFEGGANATVNIIASTGFFNTAVASDAFLDTTFGQLIAIFLGFLGTLFLALIVYSGFQWMTAGGNEEKVEQARKRILNASLGLGLIFFSYIITTIVFNFIYKQSGENANSPDPNNQNECETNNDCPTLRPLCEAFQTADGRKKLCVCYDDRGPACPNGYHCAENYLDQTRNSCEPD